MPHFDDALVLEAANFEPKRRRLDPFRDQKSTWSFRNAKNNSTNEETLSKCKKMMAFYYERKKWFLFYKFSSSGRKFATSFALSLPPF